MPQIDPSQIHSFQSQDALQSMDATDLAQELQKGHITPFELTQAAIHRLTLVNPTLQAIHSDRYDIALAHAKQQVVRADSPKLFGIPSLLKNNSEIKGAISQNGSQAYQASPSKHSSPVAELMQNMGINFIGMTKLPEFGFNASTEFSNQAATRNPWDTDCIAGGSSGGSAAVVAAGVVPFAHGNDGAGSIRIPAACCGLVGLKPSKGRIMHPKHAKILPLNILCDGIISRSVRDTALFMSEVERLQTPNSYTKKYRPIGHVTQANQRKLKIAYLTRSFTSEFDQQTQHAMDKVLQTLSDLGHELTVIPMPLPDCFSDDFLLYWAYLTFMVEKGGKYYLSATFDPSRLEPFTLSMSQYFKQHWCKFPAALMRLHQAKSRYEQVFQQYDVMFNPTLMHETPKIGYLAPDQPIDQLLERLTNYVGFTPIQNAVGAPAISLPLSRSSSQMPIGMQFSSAIGNEALLLELALQLEQAMPWVHLG